MLREVFDREGAAAYMKLHPSTISELCAAPDGLRHAKIGRTLRIRRVWCDDYLERIAAGGCVTPAADAIFSRSV